MLAQHKKTPEANLVLVSESNSLLLREDFIRISGCQSETEVRRELSKSRIKNWDRLLEVSKMTPKELIKFCGLCKIQISPLDFIKRLIDGEFKGRVTNAETVGINLFIMAFEQAKRNLRTTSKDVTGYLENVQIRLLSNLDKRSITNSLSRASLSLANNPSGFTGIQHFIIERDETSKIYKWINEPLKVSQGKPVEPILVLSGDAGTGKTTVLKHLYDKLRQDKTPVLGIKADRVAYLDEQQLKTELNLSEDIDRVIVSAIENHDQAVVIIDQIDALSLSLSKNRSQINNYTNLIYELSQIKGIRIIVSCREYDLKYDPRLTQFKNREVVKIGQLTDEQLTPLFDLLNIEFASVDYDLQELLRTPLHLDIFTRLDLQKTELSKLQTLQSLFNALWDQSIQSSETPSELRLIEFLEKLTNDLFENQRIFAHTFDYDEYRDEYTFLLSQNLLVESDDLGKFSFFHQTLFDYTLARVFTTSRLSISKEVGNSHQGLFLRNKIRAVLSFLRGTKIDEYHKEIRKILNGPEFRFHIKVLLIADLCAHKSPTQNEKRLITGIMKDEDLREVVFESIDSPEWFSYLKQSLINDLVNNSKENSFKIRQVCSRLLNHSESLVLSFLKDLPDFEERNHFISEVLFNVKAFSDESFTELFEEVKRYLFEKNHGFLYYHILEHASLEIPDWVLNELFEDVKRRVEKVETKGYYHFELLDHDAYSLYQKVFSNHPRKAYLFFKRCLFFLIESTKMDFFPRHKLEDQAFNHFHKGSKPDHDYHFIIPFSIKEYIITQVEEDPVFASKELKELKDHNFSTPCYLYIWTKIESQGFELDDTYDFILEWLLRAGFNAESRFRKCIETFLKDSYSILNSDQKNKLKSYILTNKDSVRAYQEKKLNPYYGGSQQYFLDQIPQDQLKLDQDLWKLKQELDRKGKILKGEKMRIFASEKAVPTLPTAALPKISYENWVCFFKKYSGIGNNDKRSSLHFENAYNLEKAAKESEDVNKFIDLTSRFVKNTIVPKIYCSRLICGLMEAGADNDKMLEIYEGLIENNEPINNDIDDLLAPINHFINVEKYSEKVFNWLLLCFKDGSQESGIGDVRQGDKESDDHGFMRGFNSVKGSAIFKLTGYTNTKEQFSQVIHSIEEQFQELEEYVICVIVNRLAWLNKYDKEKCLNLFVKLTQNSSSQVLNSAANSAQYMSNVDFARMNDFFKNVIDKVTSEQKMEFYGQLLTVCAEFDYPEAKDLLELAFEQNQKYKVGSLDMVVKYVLDEERSGYIDDLWNRYLVEDGRDFAFKYATFFRKCNPEKFVEFYPYMVSFTKSRAAKERAHEYYDFLLKCMANHPEKCIDLTLGSDHPKPDIRYTALRGEEPLQLIIGCYNALNEYIEDNVYLEKALDAFDDILKNPDYRFGQSNFFNALDRY